MRKEEPQVGDLVEPIFHLPSVHGVKIGLMLDVNPGTGLARVLWNGSNIIERHSPSVLRKVS